MQKGLLRHFAWLRQSSVKKRAFTLTEIAIVLAVFGAVLAGVWAASASVSEKHRVELATDEVYRIADNVRQVYRGQVNAPMPSTASLVASGVFPPDMVIGGVPTNPWGGTVVVVATYPTFSINLNKIPSQSIVSLYGNISSTGQNGAAVKASLSSSGGSSSIITGLSIRAVAALAPSYSGISFGYTF